MKLQVHAAADALEVSDKVFGCEFNQALVHQAVDVYLSGSKASTARQKTRAQVRGGGAKPWRQKGTGRARAGTRSSPIWRGGGVTFAANGPSRDKKIPRRMYRGALSAILSELARHERILVVDNFSIEAPKTRLMVQKMTDLSLKNALIVFGPEGVDEAVELAARNLTCVQVISVFQVNPVVLMRYEQVVLLRSTLPHLESWLS